jgi:hypothetical protein
MVNSTAGPDQMPPNRDRRVTGLSHCPATLPAEMNAILMPMRKQAAKGNPTRRTVIIALAVLILIAAISVYAILHPSGVVVDLP